MLEYPVDYTLFTFLSHVLRMIAGILQRMNKTLQLDPTGRAG